MIKTGVAATITVIRTDNTNTVSAVNMPPAMARPSAGTDYIATNGTFVFTNGDTSKTFSVRVIADYNGAAGQNRAAPIVQSQRRPAGRPTPPR